MMNCMLLLVVTTLSVPAQHTEALKRVQDTYKSAGDIEAGFTQTYIEKLRGKRRAETGQLWAKADGRVRWQYQSPTLKDFVFDGKLAYFYEPENAQVTVFENFRESKLSNALRFLVGSGKLSKTFDVHACKEFCDLAAEGQVVLALWPKQPLPGVDHVLMMIDGKTNRVAMSVLFDPLGNRTEYRFRNVRFHAKVDEANFQFETPEGVQELRGTSQGLAPSSR